ncbi:SH3 domain-containing protein [Sutcliffiella horikoshii]|uniref:SH3 domain-containing protein n=1 Tax=Sutcliffiella horikoshii TaxID=79883 RepID=UPI001F2E7423|nr:SH3 domain-containing protein [Sutcliffiella horikoshii]MCG1021560.1 hypothetical protein [Sutcliffiella horikoshii]
MFKFRSILFLSLLFFSLIFPQTDSHANTISHIVVAEDVVNVREGPGTNYTRITTVTMGQKFEVLTYKNEWYQIQLNATQSGWIAGWLVTPETSYKNAISLTKNLEVRSGASPKSSVIATLDKDQKVLVKREVSGWYEIVTSALTGWVYKDLLYSDTTVNNGKVDVYGSPSTRVATIGSLTNGTTITISKEINGWYYISSTGIQGWIYYSHLNNGSPNPPSSVTAEAIVLPSHLDVYSGASLRTTKIGSIAKDTKVNILTEINGWYEINSASINGWVYDGLLKTNIEVKGDFVNVYGAASTRVDTIGNLKKGDKLIITNEINGWYKFYNNQIEGWVYSDHVTNGSPNPIIISGTPAIVLPEKLPFYSGASLRTTLLGHILKDEPVTIVREINGWYEITLNQKNVWVYGGLLKSTIQSSNKIANVYGVPSTRGEVISNLQNELITVKKEINGWYYFTSDSKNGWVFSTHLIEGSPTPINVNGEKAIVLSNNLAVYSGASLRTTLVHTLSKDTPVNIIQEINGWYQIVYNNNLSGWVYGNLLKANSKVIGNYVDVYPSPTTRISPINTLNKGASFEITKEINGWYYIKSSNVTGWVFSSHVIEGSPAPVMIPAVVISSVSLRSGPGAEYSTVSSSIYKKQVYIKRQVGEWYLVSHGNNEGWLNVSTVQIITKPNTSLLGKVIVLDAGHGGVDPGAIGALLKLQEKALTLRTAKLLEEKLSGYGAIIVQTRTVDTYVELIDRARISNNNNADAFISIHYNSVWNSPTATGIETLYYNQSKDQALAQHLQSQLVSYSGLRDRGVKYQDVNVLRNNQRPAALVELGFLSNPVEEATVATNTYQEKITNAMVQGLLNYFNR